MSVKYLGHPTQLGLQMTATLANSPAKLSQLRELRFKSQSEGGGSLFYNWNILPVLFADWLCILSVIFYACTFNDKYTLLPLQNDSRVNTLFTLLFFPQSTVHLRDYSIPIYIDLPCPWTMTEENPHTTNVCSQAETQIRAELNTLSFSLPKHKKW